MAQQMKVTAAQRKVLKRVRKRVQATHWIKGAMGRIKDKSGHFAPQFWAPKENGVEKDFFVPEGSTKEYKTCGCLVGLLRWETGGVREHVYGSDYEYGEVVTLVADHLENTGRNSPGRFGRHIEGRESVIINWNDRPQTNREKVVQVLTEIIGD